MNPPWPGTKPGRKVIADRSRGGGKGSEKPHPRGGNTSEKLRPKGSLTSENLHSLRRHRRPARGHRREPLWAGSGPGSLGPPGGRRPGRRAVAAALCQAGGRAPARPAFKEKGRGQAGRPPRAEEAAPGDRPRRQEGGRAPRARTLEGSSPRSGRSPRACRRTRGLHARTFLDLDARAREPRARPRGPSAGTGTTGSRLRPVGRVQGPAG